MKYDVLGYRYSFYLTNGKHTLLNKINNSHRFKLDFLIFHAYLCAKACI